MSLYPDASVPRAALYSINYSSATKVERDFLVLLLMFRTTIRAATVRERCTASNAPLPDGRGSYSSSILQKSPNLSLGPSLLIERRFAAAEKVPAIKGIWRH